MRLSIKKISFLIITIVLFSCRQAKLTVVPETEIIRGEIKNTNNPQILYWFITEGSLKNKQYLKDIDYIARQTPFDMVVLTQRETISFYDYRIMRPVFEELVKRGHELGIKVVLQLWPKNFDSPEDKSQGIVVEKEIPIESNTQITYLAKSKNVRYSEDVMFESPNNESFYAPHPLFASPALSSHLLSAHLFKKTGEGEYKSGTLLPLPNQWIKLENEGKETVKVIIDIPEKYKDYTLYINTVHYHQYGDLFSDYFPNLFADTFRQYKHIPFDGAALDEFKYMPISKLNHDEVFRERMYSQSMAKFFLDRYDVKLEDILFNMRYAPNDAPEERAKAINLYFDVLRQGPLIVENNFYEQVKKEFGEDAFIGVHNTFHNSLERDEVWATGINWWSVKRDYGQTDERTIYPVRMGVACANSNPIAYNMYYSKIPEDYYKEAIYAARYNIRIHYHAFNDLGVWGLDFSNSVFNDHIEKIEDCLELLDRLAPPYPEMDILVVFGFPEQVNWFPNEENRGNYDTKVDLEILEKAKSLWDEGYHCALAPSYEIDEGKITLDEKNQIHYGGKVFKSMIYLGPEYLKESNLYFIERFARNNGRLMIDGQAQKSFLGDDIRDRFRQIMEQPNVYPYELNEIAKLEISKNDVDNGVRYVDGSVILADEKSILGGTTKVFHFQIKENHYEIVCQGFAGLKVDEKGDILKFTANGFESLTKNDELILRSDFPSNLYADKVAGRLNFLVEDNDTNHRIHVKK